MEHKSAKPFGPFGVFSFTWGVDRPSADAVVGLAQYAEDLGFDSVHVAWHFTYPAPSAWGNRYLLDPFVVLPIIVRRTKTINVALNAGLLPLMHPFVWAQYLSSLDVASGGRVIPVFAIGYWEQDLQVGMAKTAERGKRFEEGLGIIRKLQLGQEISERGNFWDARGLSLNPRPISPTLWIGGHEPQIERAARYADALNPTHRSPREFRDIFRGALDEAAAKYDRKVRLVQLADLLVLDKSDDPTAVRDRWMPLVEKGTKGRGSDAAIAGTPEQCADVIMRTFEAGVDYILLDPNFHGKESKAFAKEQMTRFAEAVVPRLDHSVWTKRVAVH